mmetsp:Transcript_8188/g.17638  ORF Transcript_8188/g.17638 Transcript_8188/m.17638 type:complete len:95 (+) Transcript_8188:66-350(+)
MLRTASICAARAAARAGGFEVSAIGATRAMSGEIAGGGFGRTLQDKEHGQEAVYFGKEDRELLKKLAKKVNQVCRANPPISSFFFAGGFLQRCR